MANNVMLPYADRSLPYNQIINKCNKTIIDQFYANNTLVVLDLLINTTMTTFAFDIYSTTYGSTNYNNYTYNNTYPYNNTNNYTNGGQNIVIGTIVDFSLPFSTV